MTTYHLAAGAELIRLKEALTTHNRMNYPRVFRSVVYT